MVYIINAADYTTTEVLDIVERLMSNIETNKHLYDIPYTTETEQYGEFNTYCVKGIEFTHDFHAGAVVVYQDDRADPSIFEPFHDKLHSIARDREVARQVAGYDEIYVPFQGIYIKKPVIMRSTDNSITTFNANIKAFKWNIITSKPHKQNKSMMRFSGWQNKEELLVSLNCIIIDCIGLFSYTGLTKWTNFPSLANLSKSLLDRFVDKHVYAPESSYKFEERLVSINVFTCIAITSVVHKYTALDSFYGRFMLKFITIMRDAILNWITDGDFCDDIQQTKFLNTFDEMRSNANLKNICAGRSDIYLNKSEIIQRTNAGDTLHCFITGVPMYGDIIFKLVEFQPRSKKLKKSGTISVLLPIHEVLVKYAVMYYKENTHDVYSSALSDHSIGLKNCLEANAPGYHVKMSLRVYWRVKQVRAVHYSNVLRRYKHMMRVNMRYLLDALIHYMTSKQNQSYRQQRYRPLIIRGVGSDDTVYVGSDQFSDVHVLDQLHAKSVLYQIIRVE